MFVFDITFKHGIKDTALQDTGSLSMAWNSFVLFFGWAFQRNPRELGIAGETLVFSSAWENDNSL